MLKDFRAFLMRGNVVDLAVAVVIGAAFGTIVTSFVKDLLMPPIGLALGGVNFEDLFVTLSGGSYPSLAAAKAAGAPTLNYGIFINTIINFVIVAFAVFLLVRQIDRLRATPAPPSPSTKPVMDSKRPSRAMMPKSVPTKCIGASSVPPASHVKRTRSLWASTALERRKRYVGKRSCTAWIIASMPSCLSPRRCGST